MEVRYVYTLSLEDECWYVGESTNPAMRISSHISGSGATWTNLHPPLKNPEKHIHSRIRIVGTAADAKLEEDKQLKKMMLLYGINNVRGGSYSEVNITDECFSALERELWHSGNRCLRCGRTGHYAVDCYYKKNVNGESIITTNSDRSRSPVRRAHTLDRRSQFVRSGTIYRYSMHDQLESVSESESEFDTELESDTCYRCGRQGHWASECFARRDIDGNYLVKGKGKGKGK